METEAPSAGKSLGKLSLGCGVAHTLRVHIREIDRIRRLLQVGNWNHMLESQTGYVAKLDTGNLGPIHAP